MKQHTNKIKIYFLLSIFIFTIFLQGCNLDKSNELCSILKHKHYNKSEFKFYMDNGFCILEQKNYTNVYILMCSDFPYTINHIYKIRNDSMTFEKQLSKNCEIIK